MQTRMLVPTLLLLSGTLTACRKAPAPAAVVVAEKPPADISALSDQQLVAANQSDGLGIGLRITGNRFRVDQAIPLKIVIENMAAPTPIAAGMCDGFFLAYEDTTSHESGGYSFSPNTRCMGTDPYPDSIALESGVLRVAETSSQSASRLSLTPGTYLFSVNWKAIPAGPGTIAEPIPYATLRSNPVQITIVP